MLTDGAYAVLCCAVLCSAIVMLRLFLVCQTSKLCPCKGWAVLCCAVLCRAVPCRAVLCCAVLCYIVCSCSQFAKASALAVVRHKTLVVPTVMMPMCPVSCASGVTGFAPSQHILGCCDFWGVQARLQEDLRPAGHHAGHVCCCCWGADGVCWGAAA